MAAGNAVWGIDIGQCGLKALKLQRNGDDIEAVAFDYIEHAKILSQPDADRPTLIHDALEKLLSRNSVAGEPVVVSVAGQQTFSRFTKLPPVEPKRIPEIVQFEATQQIPFDMDAVVWDYQTFTTEGSPDVEVGIFAIKRDLVRTALSHFTDLGLEPIAVQAGPLALYNGLRFDGLLGESATVVLDVGAENSDLIVAEGDSIWSRNIPLGGNNFTEALVKAFKLSFSKAENLKRTAATSKYARQIFQAMRPVFADLVAEIQRSIGFYTSTHRHAKLDRMIGMGNAFKLPGLQKFLQQNLGMTVEQPTAFKKLASTQLTGAPQFMDHLLSFGVAYGLAVQGLELAGVNSNLLPPEILKQGMWRKKRPWFAAAAACLLLASGVIAVRYLLDSRALAVNRGAEPPPRMTVDVAERTINQPPNKPGREYAAMLRLAADTLNKEYNSKAGGWDTEEQKVNSIIELQEDKSMLLKIISTIHRALPKRQPALREADETPAAIKAAYASVPRGERSEVFIHALESNYYEDVYAALAGPAPPGQQEFAAVEESKPGFLIRLEGSTPNAKGVLFLIHNLIEPLKTMTLEEKRGFYFDKVELGPVQRRGAAGGGPARAIARPRAGNRMQRPGGPGQRGGIRGPAAGPPRAAAGAPDVVPIINEPTDQDWTFDVTLVAVIGEPPESADGENE